MDVSVPTLSAVYESGIYRISLDQTAGCIYHPWLFKYAESYNSVSKPITIKKLGRDVFKECYKDGYRLFLARHPPKDQREKEWQEMQLKELESY